MRLMTKIYTQSSETEREAESAGGKKWEAEFLLFYGYLRPSDQRELRGTRSTEGFKAK